MTATATDQKDHIDALVPEIRVSDGVDVPKLPKWVPQWVMAYGNGNIPLSKMTLVEPRLQASGAGYLVPEVASRWRDLQTAAQSAGYDLTMTGAYRSLEQQKELFAARYTTQNTGQEPRTYQGKTYWLKPGNAMVASPGTSNHGWGCAVDMALRVNGGVVAVTAPFVGWAATVAVAHGFSWEDSEPWHIHAIDAGNSSGGTPSDPPSGGGVVTSIPQPTLQLGDAGNQVALLQQICTAHSWGNPGRADGQFGPRTKEAVQELQKAVGVPGDGVFGPHTAAALGQYLEK